jgi:hypothetical protein
MTLRIKVMATVFLLIGLLLSGLQSCSGNYRVGDVSKVYCNSTDEEFRRVIKNTLKGQGVELGVDYCSSYNLVDALVVVE